MSEQTKYENRVKRGITGYKKYIQDILSSKAGTDSNTDIKKAHRKIETIDNNILFIERNFPDSKLIESSLKFITETRSTFNDTIRNHYILLYDARAYVLEKHIRANKVMFS